MLDETCKCNLDDPRDDLKNESGYSILQQNERRCFPVGVDRTGIMELGIAHASLVGDLKGK